MSTPERLSDDGIINFDDSAVCVEVNLTSTSLDIFAIPQKSFYLCLVFSHTLGTQW
jgi:hypothetical protein